MFRGPFIPHYTSVMTRMFLQQDAPPYSPEIFMLDIDNMPEPQKHMHSPDTEVMNSADTYSNERGNGFKIFNTALVASDSSSNYPSRLSTMSLVSLCDMEMGNTNKASKEWDSGSDQSVASCDMD
jgi:hypothetical protein